MASTGESRAQEYERWIAANVPEHPVGLCAEMTERMAEEYPELTRVRGHFRAWTGTRERPHWWLVTADGVVVDPTAAQFNALGPGDYVPHEGPEPTGKCIECGGYCYNHQAVCSDICARAFAEAMC